MPRKRAVAKREILPDPIYQSTLGTKFVNSLMHDGKKSTAEAIFYGALDAVKERLNEDPMRIFQRAVENAKPMLEVKSRRVGGATYQVPVEIRPDRRTALAIRWIIDYARTRGEKGMTMKLANEILDAYYNKGATIKKKEDVHKMAEANQAFAHYRW